MTCEQTTGPSELKGVSTGAASSRPRSSAGAPTSQTPLQPPAGPA